MTQDYCILTHQEDVERVT